MAENPLLPNAELRALLALTRRCRTLDTALARKGSGGSRAAFRPLPAREALLAGTAVQLKPGDLLLPEPGDTTAVALRPVPDGAPNAGVPLLPSTLAHPSRLIVAAAMAAALKAAGTDRLVLAYQRSGAVDPDWPAALAWAQERLLPFVLVCADARGASALRPDARPSSKALSWEAVRRAAGRLQLPVLSVDGGDAVAVYRVMQESILRARAGGGPAVLWAMLPSPRELAAGLPPSAQPLGRLRAYLRTRKISV